jgi:uncharacterized protein YbjT (DUF2867 family)
MRIRVILFGATGMVGEGVLHEALNDDRVEHVLAIGRRSCDVRHQKLTEIIHTNFFQYADLEPQLTGFDACFFCLGVTSIGKTESEYTRLTYTLTMEAARPLARLNPSMTFCYVSGAGTDSSEHGRSMWARVKGKTENDLMKLPFKAVYAFRPGYIRPTKGLRHAFALSRAIGFFYPVLNVVAAKFVCTLEELGLAMIHVATEGLQQHILECRDISRLRHISMIPR